MATQTPECSSTFNSTATLDPAGLVFLVPLGCRSPSGPSVGVPYISLCVLMLAEAVILFILGWRGTLKLPFKKVTRFSSLVCPL
jgi:hypothetical protein